jgi:hypothetical protein
MISGGEELREINPNASIYRLGFQLYRYSARRHIFGISFLMTFCPGDLAVHYHSLQMARQGIFHSFSPSLYRVFAAGRILQRTGFERKTSSSPIARRAP